MNKTLYLEIKEIMKHNFQDYCAEEDDKRFNYTIYNNALKKIKSGENLSNTKNFSEMCAYINYFEKTPYRKWQMDFESHRNNYNIACNLI